ncbi:DUF790 family protein [bacterium]|nr:DUF790 family protein [bacterium]
MLTGNLIRYRIYKDTVRPRYITRQQASGYLKVCRQLIDLFRTHQGKTRSELYVSLQEIEGKRTDYNIFRGLAKLLEEKAEFCPIQDIDYPELRQQIFLHAQKYYPIVLKPDLIHSATREKILHYIATETDVSCEEMDSLFYGDLPENHVLVSFENGYSAESLLKRYNLALAQGLLYRAVRLKILLSGDYRVVFQYIKLARLIHWVKPIRQSGFEIVLNGSASLFRNTQRYGIRMANFLPGLLLASDWSMEADIETDEGVKKFYLNSNCGLTSHYRSPAEFDSQIEKKFFEKFSRKNRGWSIEREGTIIDLGDTVFIPDFVFRHAGGRTTFLEIVGFWTEEYLKKKMEKIRQAKCKNLMLAVNSQLNCSRQDFKEDVIFYRTGIPIGKVIERLEKIKS